MVAHSISKKNLHSGDSIILTQMEHHANIVPWQMVAEEKNLEIRVVSVLEDGSLNLDELNPFLAEEASKVLSLCHISNSLGTINPMDEIIREAHAHNVQVIVDGAQSVPHGRVDLKAMDCDFFAFSGHKVLAQWESVFCTEKKKSLNLSPPIRAGVT